MVPQSFLYLGELRCKATHGPSGVELVTDAPTDNQGRGESFSPTDLVVTALATCQATTMGIVASRDNVTLDGTKVFARTCPVARSLHPDVTLDLAFSYPD